MIMGKNNEKLIDLTGKIDTDSGTVWYNRGNFIGYIKAKYLAGREKNKIKTNLPTFAKKYASREGSVINKSEQQDAMSGKTNVELNEIGMKSEEKINKEKIIDKSEIITKNERKEKVNIIQEDPYQNVFYSSKKFGFTTMGEEPYELKKSKFQRLTFFENEKYIKSSKWKNFSTAEKKQIGMITPDGYFSNLALLLSDQCQHRIKITEYDDLRKNNLKKIKEFTGSIINQMEEVCDYIEQLNKENNEEENIFYSKPKDYSQEDIREIIVNAIVHRNYAFSASTIINIYIDKLEIISAGGLLSGISKDAVLLGISQPRNECLFSLFRMLKIIDGMGNGITSLISKYEGKIEKPEIKVVDGAFQVTLINANYMNEISMQQENINNNKSDLLKPIDNLSENISLVKDIEEFTASKRVSEGHTIENWVDSDSTKKVEEKEKTIENEIEYVSVEENSEEEIEDNNIERVVPKHKRVSEKKECIEKYDKNSDFKGQYKKVLKLATKIEFFTRKDVEKKLKLKQSRVLSILKDMTDSGMLEKSGVGKSTLYRVNDN
jgi:predicted HTH transcriptional regulator